MLSERVRQPELMDDPALEHQQHVAALRGLQRIHAISGTLGRMWRPIQPLLTAQPNAPLSVMDVGCGDGLLLRQLFHRARRHGYTLRLIGCDFSPRALELAQEAAEREHVPMEVQLVDVSCQALPTSADVVINSLFLHHFDDLMVVQILQQLARAARQMVLVEDLVRSPLGFALCWFGVRLLTRSRVVHVDGPLSVRAAFNMAELRLLLERAGWEQARVDRRWPERYFVQHVPDTQQTSVKATTATAGVERHGS